MRSALVVALMLLGGALGVSAQTENYQYYLSFPGDPILREVVLVFNTPVENTPAVMRTDEKPVGVPAPAQVVLSYLTITADEQAQSMELNFAISCQWLQQNHALENEVKVLKYDDGWIQFTPDLTGKDENFVYYHAEVDFPQILAIVASQQASSNPFLPAVVIIIGLVAFSVAYWFVIRPRKPFAPLKKLKSEMRAPVIKEEPKAEERMVHALRKLRESASAREKQKHTKQHKKRG